MAVPQQVSQAEVTPVVAKVENEEAAATKIQAVYRGYLVVQMGTYGAGILPTLEKFTESPPVSEAKGGNLICIFGLCWS